MMRCVIVDDEQLARDVLEMYVTNNHDLQLVGICKNAREALNIIENQVVDVMFLDIQMPDVSGMNLVKSMKNPPLVVFTTAYEDYALEGYEVSAIDYLLKPFSPERFDKAVEKVKTIIGLQHNASNDDEDYMFVRADYQDVKIKFSEIQYVEGLKDYVKIVLSEKKIITLMNIKGILEKLPDDRFVRVHKSYIVALDKIQSAKGRSLVIGDKEIPIGLTFRDDFKKRFSNL